jgi:hypothetical protein
MFTKNFTRGIVLGLLLLALFVPNISLKLQPNSDRTALAAGVEPMVNIITAEVKVEEDRRVEILKNYLQSKNSPLAEFADDFVAAADKYDTDYRLLPAIAGIESNFGRVQLDNSYNPFGWGGGYVYFDSFDEAIWTVSRELYERAIVYGVDTPRELAPSYCPPNSLRWTTAVEGFMAEI